MKARVWSAILDPVLRRDYGAGAGLATSAYGNFPPSSFRRRRESRTSHTTFYRAMYFSSITTIPDEAALRLYPCQPEKRNALRWSDFRSGAAHLATQERSGGWIYQKVLGSYLGLVRAPRNDGVSHRSRKGDQRMATGVENQTHRIYQPAMAGSLQRDRLRHAFSTPAFARVTAENDALFFPRHSGAGRNPGLRSSRWIPVLAEKSLECTP